MIDELGQPGIQCLEGKVIEKVVLSAKNLQVGLILVH